ncbi:MAG TPA: hypothetical protein VLX28_05590 [Thermoanaerobaculia bacterium]|nr:hypothetical protein [Thermoanaerobaculia bacterium]
MWPELKEQIGVEEAQLQHLLELHRPLLEKCQSEEPSPIELSALAALLHSYYTGIENLFRRVAIEVDGGTIHGDAWHRRLLHQMTEDNENRPPVISLDLLDRLQPYLQFRHCFRHSYSFLLRWDKLEPLILQCEETFTALRGEIATFTTSMERLHQD